VTNACVVCSLGLAGEPQEFHQGVYSFRCKYLNDWTENAKK